MDWKRAKHKWWLCNKVKWTVFNIWQDSKCSNNIKNNIQILRQCIRDGRNHIRRPRGEDLENHKYVTQERNNKFNKTNAIQCLFCLRALLCKLRFCLPNLKSCVDFLYKLWGVWENYISKVKTSLFCRACSFLNTLVLHVDSGKISTNYISAIHVLSV